MRRTIAATMVASLVACSLGAAAAPRAGHGEGGLLRNFFRDRAGSFVKLSQDVDLSQEQRNKIRDVLVEHRSEIAGVAQPIMEKRRVLRDAVLADKPSDDAIRSAANDLGKAIGDAAVLAAKVKPEVAKVLTSEQQARVKDFHKQNDKAVEELLEKIASHK